MKLRLKNNDVLEVSRDVKTYLFLIEISKLEQRIRALNQNVEMIVNKNYSSYDPKRIGVTLSDLREVEKFRIRIERFSDFFQPYVEAYNDKDVL